MRDTADTVLNEKVVVFGRPVPDADCAPHEAPSQVPEAEGESQTTHVTGGLAAMLDAVFRSVPLAPGEAVDVALARNGTRMIVIADFAEPVMAALDAHMRKHRISEPVEDGPAAPEPHETVTDKAEIERALADTVEASPV